VRAGVLAATSRTQGARDDGVYVRQNHGSGGKYGRTGERGGGHPRALATDIT